MRIDKEQNNMRTPIFNYELFYPINGSNNLVKLDLSECNGINIDIIIPLDEKINNDDLDKYNKSSGYYNDICYTTNSEHNTDIILSDRKQEYVDKNMSICEINCDTIFYNSEENKAISSCGIKMEIPFMKDIKFDKDILLGSFTDVKNYMNVKILSCYEIVFKKKNLLKNYGFFIFSFLIFINIIYFFLFFCKFYKKLILIIQKLRLNIVSNNKISFNNNINNVLGKNRIKNNNINNQNNFKSSERKIIKKKSNVLNSKNIKKKNNKKYQIRLDNKDKKKKLNPEFKININNNSNNKTNFFILKNNNKKKNNNNKINNKKTQNVNNNIKSSTKIIMPIKLSIYELNSLEFKEALTKDKRTYSQYYISLLNTNHSLIYIFHSDDYNSPIIKLSIFIFNLSCLLSVNALFFNDETMHKIYSDKGSFNIIYQLPQIIYSSLISSLLNFIIKMLGLSGVKILEIKKAKMNEIIKKENGIINIVKIKFALFHLVDFLFLIAFWYYVTFFCGIYKNTQMHLIKDSLISFGTSLISPFFIYLLPGIFRILGLKNKNKCFYGLSKLLQLL